MIESRGCFVRDRANESGLKRDGRVKIKTRTSEQPVAWVSYVFG